MAIKNSALLQAITKSLFALLAIKWLTGHYILLKSESAISDVTRARACVFRADSIVLLELVK
jgi:hypothetical protein